VTLSLNKDIDSIPEGSHARNVFISDFKRDVGYRLGVGYDRITISRITAGSIDVAFQIEPDGNGGAIDDQAILNAFNHPGIPIAGATTLEAVTRESLLASNPPPPPPPPPRQRSKPAETPWGLIYGGLIFLGASLGLVVFGAANHYHCQKDKGEKDATETDNPLSTE
jgi:hypothetical protein